MHCPSDKDSALSDAALKQPNRGVKLLRSYCRHFKLIRSLANSLKYSIDEAFKAGQTRGIGNPGTAEKHNAAFFVRLKQSFRYVWSVLNELHGQPSLV